MWGAAPAVHGGAAAGVHISMAQRPPPPRRSRTRRRGPRGCGATGWARWRPPCARCLPSRCPRKREAPRARLLLLLLPLSPRMGCVCMLRALRQACPTQHGPPHPPRYAAQLAAMILRPRLPRRWVGRTAGAEWLPRFMPGWLQDRRARLRGVCAPVRLLPCPALPCGAAPPTRCTRTHSPPPPQGAVEGARHQRPGAADAPQRRGAARGARGARGRRRQRQRRQEGAVARPHASAGVYTLNCTCCLAVQK